MIETPPLTLAAPLPRSFYDRPTELVARELLGCLLVFRHGDQTRVARIVETEAYLGTKDLACHAAKGRTARTEPLFGPPGFAYVYFVYGMHHCLNAVTREEGAAEAVLFRAVEPLQHLSRTADGPGKLCAAMGIALAQNRMDLCGGTLFITPGTPPRGIVRGPRIGVDYAGRWAKRLLRFHERGSRFVSPAGGARKTTRQARAMRGAP